MFIMYVFLIGYSLHEVKEDLESTRYHSYLGPTELDEPPTDGAKQVHVEIRVTGVDVLRNRIDAWVYFFPSRDISTASGELNFPVYYSLKYYSNSFNASDIMDPIEITIPFLRGTHYYYPFDLYKAELAIDIMDSRTDTALPIEIDILVSTPSLWFDIFRINNDPDDDIEVPYEDNLYKLDIVITRPGFVVIFSVFVVFLMWALSLAVLSMAISITVFSPARPGAPYLGLSLTCLFALPNLRSTQPGVPPLGILIDVIGYFWYAWL
ncbi:hypothetical protein DSO57_1019017 [Entomophthora muscae]|uniref:Uncharacterized protein n=1 Tax=Entomophthora muscae TaxID=34485 RepID=A0ACC2RVB6_9FUNG|nr:hypothetical protein DSO57_1019017 [Entomophthora muscae]